MVDPNDIEISSALKRTKIEDIKAAIGSDSIQKLEKVFVKEIRKINNFNMWFDPCYKCYNIFFVSELISFPHPELDGIGVKLCKKCHKDVLRDVLRKTRKEKLIKLNEIL